MKILTVVGWKVCHTMKNGVEVLKFVGDGEELGIRRRET